MAIVFLIAGINGTYAIDGIVARQFTRMSKEAILIHDLARVLSSDVSKVNLLKLSGAFNAVKQRQIFSILYYHNYDSVVTRFHQTSFSSAFVRISQGLGTLIVLNGLSGASR